MDKIKQCTTLSNKGNKMKEGGENINSKNEIIFNKNFMKLYGIAPTSFSKQGPLEAMFLPVINNSIIQDKVY